MQALPGGPQGIAATDSCALNSMNNENTHAISSLHGTVVCFSWNVNRFAMPASFCPLLEIINHYAIEQATAQELLRERT
jgi:hypothetical protein